MKMALLHRCCCLFCPELFSCFRFLFVQFHDFSDIHSLDVLDKLSAQIAIIVEQIRSTQPEPWHQLMTPFPTTMTSPLHAVRHGVSKESDTDCRGPQNDLGAKGCFMFFLMHVLPKTHPASFVRPSFFGRASIFFYVSGDGPACVACCHQFSRVQKGLRSLGATGPG